MRRVGIFVLWITSWGVLGCGSVDDPSLHPVFDAATAVPPADNPFVEADPERNLLWGDLHIHTSLSTDAFIMGVRALPDAAYTFARGGEIAHGAGYGIRISRPLDFAAVTDHSEFLGVVRHRDPDLPFSVRSLRKRLLEDSPLRTTLAWARTMIGFDPRDIETEGAEEISLSAWQQIIDSAERNNQPGRFTSFIGYEWSSMPDRNNLHRNVIYRGSKVPRLPYSSLESLDPQDLWAALEAQREQGMDNLAIPHNGNVSGGKMYGSVAYDGTPFDAEYAARRMRNEPVSEIFQVKGSSETHPQLSPDDPFAGFEILDVILSSEIRPSEPKGSYMRDALRVGLEMAHNEGFNPYRFGVIGSSDGHNASSPVEEDSFHGKLPMFDGSAGIRMGKSLLLPEDFQISRRWGAAGLAAVWAVANTREAIFDAIRRRETYSTSGPRIRVRFFGGWGYPQDLILRADRVAAAEATGVPMGSALPSRAGGAPTFAVWALSDPEGANLDRIQVIKGWVDAEGTSHEKIYDVAAAGDRKPNSDQAPIPAVGNTVDIESATYQNTIGEKHLSAVWTDPDFDPVHGAFYYARVIEIPTPRWTTFDAKALGIEAPEPTAIQERAITSAIWYQPEESAPN